MSTSCSGPLSPTAVGLAPGGADVAAGGAAAAADPVVAEGRIVGAALDAVAALKADDLVLEGIGGAAAGAVPGAISLSRQVGFLNLLRALVAKLGHHTVPFMPHFTAVLFAVLLALAPVLRWAVVLDPFSFSVVFSPLVLGTVVPDVPPLPT